METILRFCEAFLLCYIHYKCGVENTEDTGDAPVFAEILRINQEN